MKKWISLVLIVLFLSGCAPQDRPLPMEPQLVEYSFEALGGGMHLNAEPSLSPVLKGEHYALYYIENAEQVWQLEQSVGFSPLWQNRSVDEPYDYAYFRERVLLVLYRVTPSCSQVCWIEKVERTEDTLQIYLVDGTPRMGDDGMGECLLGIELSKTLADEITHYEVLIREQTVCNT